MSDEPEGTGSVVTQPTRPTGKRSRRGAAVDDSSTGAQEAPSIEETGKKKKTKKAGTGPRRNPIAFVINYLREVIGELRKVIWPNRNQMVTYTIVVLVFLAFMVTLIGFVDLGVAKLVTIVFG
ncbi:preprotein translocase subunit SecE [Mycolicibacterium sp. 120270]|uniref:preprotein translocase subunit SecE n=1 Tax=Mycolicibacterium sp. 120270 TaxID=3090600 RepID=UPI00299D2CDC|nr:preprotein translocase subunit SecE [Mycolicibacterium sp. 120270]MDX1884686.1 preprotein translocase subunit SecE [Mycolicibacterium sp. 120270]